MKGCGGLRDYGNTNKIIKKMEKITPGMSGENAANLIYQNDIKSVFAPWVNKTYKGPASVAFNDNMYYLPEGANTSASPPSAPWVAYIRGTSPLEKVRQWILAEAYTINSYTENVNGIATAQIAYPDGLAGSISSVTYDAQGRPITMVFIYGAVAIFTITLTITYLNNQIQTSIT